MILDINGEWVESPHLFANPLDSDAPRADDPNVIFFGPGVQEASHLVGGDNQTAWTIPIRQSDRVTVSNLKRLGYRANSDGRTCTSYRKVLARSASNQDYPPSENPIFDH